MQIMPFEEAKTYRFNPFDLTKVWPHADYPLIEVGRMTLDRNPTDHHSEIEQLAVEPSNLVPGIGPSPDKMLLGRMFSYPDAHRSRIGANYNQLPVNAPRSPVHSYSTAATCATSNGHRPGVRAELQGRPAGRHRPLRRARRLAHRRGDGARRLHPARRGRRLGPGRHAGPRGDGRRGARPAWSDNIVGHLLNGVTEPVLQRAFEYWRNVDKDLGKRVEKGVRQ